MKKKKFISLIIVILLLINPILVFADSEESLRKAKDQTTEALQKLKEMKVSEGNKYSNTVTLPEKGAPYSSYNTSGLNSDYFAKTGESPYTKAKIMEGLLDTALAAAFSIGTSEQKNSADDLRAMAKDLESSGVPEYKEMATYLQKEADCIDASDEYCAKGEADNLKNLVNQLMPRIDPNYTPTASEKAALNPFAKFLQGFAGKVMAKISDYMLQQLLSMLGLVGKFGGPIGAIVAALGESIIENLNDSEAAGSSFGDKTADALTGKMDEIKNNFGKKTDTNNSSSSSNNNTSNNTNVGPISRDKGGSVDSVPASQDKSYFK